MKDTVTPFTENAGLAQVLDQPLIESFHDSERVRDPIHNLYRYPARFSPRFVSQVIQSLSSPGDLVVDPFLGGGTTAIESRLAGRRFIGCDISELACFVSKVKSTPLTERECTTIDRSIAFFSMKGRPRLNFNEYYFRNMMEADTHHLAQIISKMMAWSESFKNERLCGIARIIVLRAAQIAIDGKLRFPTEKDFIDLFHRTGTECVSTLRRYSRRVRTVDRDVAVGKGNIRSKIVNDVARNLDKWCKPGKATLLITSPPYPGIHILYHRWQLKGGKETPLPFLIAGKRDGHGLTHYTMNARRAKDDEKSYYKQIQNSFSGVRKLLREDAMIVQLMAFSEPSSQLPRYREAMHAAGYAEASSTSDLIRLVPNRRWHAMMKGATTSSREYLLLHRPD